MVEKKIKEFVEECIKSGKSFSETNDALKENDFEYPGLNGVFYTWQKKLNPDIIGAVENVATKKVEKEKVEKKKPLKLLSKRDLKEADESKIAGLINQGLFFVVPCENQKLTLEDVQEINVGGGVVGVLRYYVPGFNLDHPLIILVTRVAIFVIKIKQICGKISLKLRKKAKVQSTMTDEEIKQQQFYTGLAEDNEPRLK